MSAPLVFLDCETTGLSLDDDIWEFAAVRREPDGEENELHMFIEHDREKCARLPEDFRRDHYDRYRDHRAVARTAAAQAICTFFGGYSQVHKAHVVGAVPNFDTERIAKLARDTGQRLPRWHYHLIDVENLAVGYLAGTLSADRSAGLNPRRELPDLPWESETLSLLVGVDPEQFARHTAMGDVRWAMAIYDAVIGGAS